MYQSTQRDSDTMPDSGLVAAQGKRARTDDKGDEEALSALLERIPDMSAEKTAGAVAKAAAEQAAEAVMTKFTEQFKRHRREVATTIDAKISPMDQRIMELGKNYDELKEKIDSLNPARRARSVVARPHPPGPSGPCRRIVNHLFHVGWKPRTL